MVDAVVRVSDELLKKYESLSNATVLGELSRRDYKKVYMTGVHSLAKGRRMVGRAVTLRYLPSRPDLQEYVTRGGHGEGFNETPRWDALEALTPGDVLVADCMGMGDTSTGGDVVFSRIVTQKAGGLVTDGAIRDGHKVVLSGIRCSRVAAPRRLVSPTFCLTRLTSRYSAEGCLCGRVT